MSSQKILFYYPFYWQLVERRDNVLADASLDQVPQLPDGGVVGAGVVEHHHAPVLNVVQPTLAGYESA